MAVTDADAIRAAVYRIEEVRNLVVSLADGSIVSVFLAPDGTATVDAFRPGGLATTTYGQKLVVRVSDLHLHFQIRVTAEDYTDVTVALCQVVGIHSNRPGNRKMMLYHVDE